MPAANFQSVNANGWSNTYASPPTFAPTSSPEIFTVSRPGYDVTGAAVTVADDLICMARLRQAYPSQASLTADQVVMSDFVFSGDTISSVTNNSTRVAPLPIPRWLNRDREICKGNTYRAMLSVVHAYARSGKPVAAVKFIATDGSTTVQQIVTAMSLASYSASGFSVPHYAADLDMTGFANGATITIDAIIYPWVGLAFQASVHADTYPSPNFTTLRALCDRTGAYGTAYAYVDVTLGNDGTAVTSATPATAAALPYATLAAAATAIKAFNNANYARNFGDGGIIRLVAGTHILSAAIRTPGSTNGWPLTIEAADPSARLTTILQDRGSTLASSLPNQTVFRNMTFKRSGAGSFTFLDNASASLTFSNVMAFENCHFDANGTAAYNGWIYKTGLCYYINCTQNGPVGQAGITGVVCKATAALGCNGAFAGSSTTYAVLGSNIQNSGSMFTQMVATAALPAGAGQMAGWSQLTITVDGLKAVVTTDPIGPRGFALVGCVLEMTGGVTGPVLSITADNIVTAAENVLIICCTAVGARSNFGYQDTGSTTIPKMIYHRFCSHDEYNMKSDVFGTNGNLVGNWPVVFKAGARANTSRRGDSNAGSVPTVGSWLGEIAALGDVNGSDGAPLSLPWVNDKSFLGAGGGGGDYTPTSGTQVSLIPAGMAPWSHDFMGRAIPNDGTAKAGALQMVASGATGTASGSIDFTGTAQGLAPSQGASSGSIPLSGTAQAVALAQGSASGGIAVTGTAQGAAPSAGQASGAIAFTGSSQGIAPAIGQASGVIAFTGASVGVSVVIGGAAGAIAFAGAATGAANVNAAASGVLPLTGAGSGITGSTAIGVASGSISLSGTASGLAPVAGVASSGLGLTGASTGLAGVSAIGVAAGAISLTGAGAGVAPVVGAASGAIALAGSGQGAVAARGAGVGVLSFSGASGGVAIIVGGASGTISLSGSARAGAVTPGAIAMFRVPAVWALHASTAEWREFEITGAWRLHSIAAQWRAA